MQRHRAPAFGFLILVVLVLAGCAAKYPGEHSQIMADASLNNLGAQGAPQQSVAAEWAIRDLLALTAEQNTEHSWLLYGVIGLLDITAVANVRASRQLAELGHEVQALRAAQAAALATDEDGEDRDAAAG